MIDNPSELPAQAEDARRRIGEIATTSIDAGIRFVLMTSRGTPRYVLDPAPMVDPETRKNCVLIGPDEFRRQFPEIALLVRLHDVPFGIVVRGRLCAVLRRHPDAEPLSAKRYHDLFQRNRGDEAVTGLPAVIDYLHKLEARLSALEKGASSPRRRVRERSS